MCLALVGTEAKLKLLAILKFWSNLVRAFPGRDEGQKTNKP